jgi:hypothetical protein
MNQLKDNGAKNYLLSFAVDAKKIYNFDEDDNSLIVDSGAFSLWNKGAGTIDIDEYLAFINSLEHGDITCINLDVIPQTGSSKAEINKCVEQGFENYLYLKSKSKHKIMPVYHYGENISILKRYADHTDYIGISPANDTAEVVKRAFLDKVFGYTRDKIKLHGLGYSSFGGLYIYPFYSIDSITYLRCDIYIDRHYMRMFVNGKAMSYYSNLRIREFIDLEKTVTEIWRKRGITWD